MNYYKLESLENIKAIQEDASNALTELQMTIDDISSAINDLEHEVVDIEDYQALKDDVADLIVAIKTNNESARDQCLQFLKEYFTVDERRNITHEIERESQK